MAIPPSWYVSFYDDLSGADHLILHTYWGLSSREEAYAWARRTLLERYWGSRRLEEPTRLAALQAIVLTTPDEELGRLFRERFGILLEVGPSRLRQAPEEA